MAEAPSGKAADDNSGERDSRLATSAKNLMTLGAIFLAGVITGVVGPRQWLPAIARGEDPEIKSMQEQLRLKDVQISSLEAQVNLFKSVADTTKQQNDEVLNALKQASAGTTDLQRRLDSEREAKNRAEVRAEATRAEMRSLVNSAPDLESLGLWANGRPTASARAMARTIYLPNEALRLSLVEALGQDRHGIEAQKELVILLHKNKEMQERCKNAEAASLKAFDELTVPLPACLPSMKLGECDKLMDKWSRDSDEQSRNYRQASEASTTCQVEQISLEAGLTEAISAATIASTR